MSLRISPSSCIGLALLLATGSWTVLRATDVRGQVWATTGTPPAFEPLPGARVVLAEISGSGSYRTQSDRSGLVVFVGVKTGIYRMTASAEERLTTTLFPVTVGAQRALPSDITLVLSPGRRRGGESLGSSAPILGVLVQNRRLVSGARVCFTGTTMLESCSITNAVGMYDSMLVGGIYTAKVYVEGSLLHEERLRVHGGQDNIANFVIENDRLLMQAPVLTLPPQ